MKILIICAIMTLGMLGEMFYRAVEEKGVKSLKLLLMLIVYAVYASVMIFMYNIVPIFKIIAFLPLFMLISGIVATGIEFCFGLLYNKLMKADLWIYKDVYIKIGKFKIYSKNQIELSHTLLYIILSPLVIYVDEVIRFLAK